MLARCIIKSNLNLIADYNKNTLTIELFSLSTPRENMAVKNICNILNEQNAMYPNTKLRNCFGIT